MNEKPFDKYEQRGAYHWEWYKANKFSYKDKIHMICLHLPTHGSVLDIGGGDGVLSYRLFENGLNVTCVDSNFHAVQQGERKVREALYGRGPFAFTRRLLSDWNVRPRALARRYQAGELTFIHASVFELELESSFDYIVCHEVIEHVPEPDRLVAWIYQNMRHFAVISTPDVSHSPPHALDYHSWTPESFSELLKDYRFEYIFKNGYDMYVKLYK